MDLTAKVCFPSMPASTTLFSPITYVIHLKDEEDELPALCALRIQKLKLKSSVAKDKQDALSGSSTIYQ